MQQIKALDQVVTGDYAIYHGDACELIRAVPDNSVHFGIHSPPFEGLYKFTNSPRDISNNEGEAFWEHYQFLIRELLRVAMPGRLHSVHVMQLPATKGREGFIGMRDFRGDVIRAYQAAGWLLHSEVCVWKDPVVAQQRTKSIRLLHKQLCKDSALSGQGLADYIVTFRKPGDNEIAIVGELEHYAGDAVDVSRAAWERQAEALRAEGKEPWPYRTWVSIMTWQRYASPVWTDIRQTRTLQYRSARDEKDEQHISPLQLDVIERCIDLWSNRGETVITPFMGIGSEVYCAVEAGRRGVGFELKASYFRQAVLNIQRLDDQLMADLLGVAA
ncbi:MAG: site-specific DNA-methyltransferase [Proteobacteria bacterium]|nr:MAG: site-specific DNA-methyltransferase [Pseudomonadota bacterium]